jgi:hypothetical protein
MRRLDRAYERLADRGYRSDPESVIDRLERRLAEESDVIALSVVTSAGRRESRARPQWRRNALAFAGGMLALTVAIGGAVWLLRPSSQDEVAATTIPPVTTIPPGVTTTTLEQATTTTQEPTTTTTLEQVVAPPLDPPVITFERIDAPGAFDLAEGEYVGPGQEPEAVPGQTIESILAVEDCPDGPGCGDVAMYVAGGRTGMVRAFGAATTDPHYPGWDAAIWISEDGRNWTAVTGPGFAGSDGQRVTALASDGSRIVAVGTFSAYGSPWDSQPLVWYSDDLGRTWTEVEDESFVNRPCREWDVNQCFPGGMMDVAWTGEGFVGVGDGFWFSPDGITWDLTTELEYHLVATSLSQWGTRWIAVGRGPRISMPGLEVMPGSEEGRRDQDSAAVWISDDARSWELVFVDDSNWGFAADVVAGPDGAVVVGWTWSGHWDVRLPAAWHSPDGTTWEAVFPTEQELASALSWMGLMDHVIRMDGWLIAADEAYREGSHPQRGAPPNMWASPDGGVTWIEITLGIAGFDLGEDRILAVEVLPFGGEFKLFVTGFHLTDAAIWVGTLEE